jgi:NTE family protein
VFDAQSTRDCSTGPIALVLSGGGVRGAYEVGITAGIVEALRDAPRPDQLFRIFAGTSVGAINVAYLASKAHERDLGVDSLIARWCGLRLDEHLRVTPLRMFRSDPEHFGRSLLDPGPLERLIESSIDWNGLHDNTRDGRVIALIVAALEIATGQTSMFAELSHPEGFRPSRDPRRRAVVGPIRSHHVVASAALPLLFPARLIDGAYYCDGGLRFNTPIAPAIRTGAHKLVIVSVQHDLFRAKAAPRVDHTGDYPSFTFLLGKLLNALLLDPVAYDLQILGRFNRLWDVLERALEPDELAAVQDILIDTRGASYRRIDTLVFTPSQDIGAIAADFVKHDLPTRKLGWLSRWLLGRASRTRLGRDADLASYMMFDGGFARRLIDLGRRDALARRDEIRTFFASGDASPSG